MISRHVPKLTEYPIAGLLIEAECLKTKSFKM